MSETPESTYVYLLYTMRNVEELFTRKAFNRLSYVVVLYYQNYY